MAFSVSKKHWSIAVVAVATVGALALMYRLQSVCNPFLLALALAYILNPLVKFCERRRLPRRLTIGLIFAGFLFMAVIATVIVAPLAWREGRAWLVEVAGENWSDLNGNQRYDPECESFHDENGNGRFDPGYLKRLQNWLAAAHQRDSAIKRFIAELLPPEQSQHLLSEGMTALRQGTRTLLADADKWLAAAWHGGLDSVSRLFNFLLLLLLTPIYLAFLLDSLDEGWAILVRYIPAAIRPRTLSILAKIDLVMAAFFRGRLLVCLAIALVCAIGFWMLGVRFGLFLGLAIGALSLIPFLNIIGLALALISCWLDGFSLGGYAALLVIYAVSQALDPLLTTWIMGKELQLHPITILLSLFACASLFGFFGMLLAVPIVATAKILAQEFLLPHLEALAVSTEAAAAAKQKSDSL